MKAKKKGLSFFDKLFIGLNALLILALLISYLAPYIDPRKSWPIAFFGLAYPLLLVSNLLIIIFWLLRRRWYFLISLGCILIGWNVLANTIGFHLSSDDVAKPNGNAIRVLTYNVHDFKKYGAVHDTSTKHEILLLLQQQQPDILGFQEFRSTKGHFDMIDSIKSALKMDYCYFEPFTKNVHKSIGMAIFSKYPIVSQGIIKLSGLYNENQCLYIDIKKDAQTIRYYSVHLRSIHFDPEDYTYLDHVSQKGANMTSTQKVKNKLVSAFQIRSEQVVKIKEDAAKCPYPYVIAGDFNDTPSSYAVHQMNAGLKNAFREKGCGLGKTYNGDFPNYQIDYVMASPQFDVVSYKVIEKKLSDHYPVRSDVVLRSNL